MCQPHRIRQTFLVCALFAVVVFSGFVSCKSTRSTTTILILRDAKSGRVYTSYELTENAEFSISFRHSVNQSIVEEGFTVRDGVIFLDWCKFTSFGAGMTDVLEAGQNLVNLPEGKMLINGFNRRIPHLSYEISTIYDHVLCINAEQINLTALGLKGKRVEFAVLQVNVQRAL